MADTQRTLTEIMALLADNITANIGAQDHRDAVETSRFGFGEIYVTTPAATVITSTVSWFRDAGTYTLTQGDRWEMGPANGQLRYIGPANRIVFIPVTISMTGASNNQVVELAVAKNGIVIESSRVKRKVGTGADVGALPLHAAASVSTGDYFDVRIRNTTSATNITLETCSMFAFDMATY